MMTPYSNVSNKIMVDWKTHKIEEETLNYKKVRTNKKENDNWNFMFGLSSLGLKETVMDHNDKT